MRRLLLLLTVLMLFGCQSPTTSTGIAGKSVSSRIPIILGSAPKSITSARSLNSDTYDTGIPNLNVPAVSIAPIITGWSATQTTIQTGQTLTYSVFGNSVDVVASINADDSVTYSGNFTDSTVVGGLDPTYDPVMSVSNDSNVSSLTTTISADQTTFTYNQVLYVNFWSYDSSKTSFFLNYQIYSNTSGSGSFTLTGYTATGTAMYVQNDYSTGSATAVSNEILNNGGSISNQNYYLSPVGNLFESPGWTSTVQSIAFLAKSDSNNVAVLLNQAFATPASATLITPSLIAGLAFPATPSSPDSSTNTVVFWKMTSTNPWLVSSAYSGLPWVLQAYSSYTNSSDVNYSVQLLSGSPYPVSLPYNSSSYSPSTAYSWFDSL